jgi:hypothetical protein
MRRLLALVAILAVGCSGGPASSPTAAGPGASDGPAASGTAPSGASSAPSDVPAASGGAALPARCAEGFSAYLVAIEPLVSKVDPAKATLGDLSTVEEAVRSKSIELLTANDSRAPYSCPEVGLEFAYFDASSPWEAVLATAASAAPGTVAYLTARRDIANLDVAKVGDYGVSGCEEAVASIKKGVAKQTSGGTAGVEEMGLQDGLALLGLYRAYMADVGKEVCPRDELGNDEFGFFGAMG